MADSELIAATEQFVREQLAGDSTGHDWWHVDRVRDVASFLAKSESADLEIVELAALLHDIADQKFHHGKSEVGVEMARAFLTKLDASPETVMRVCDAIASSSYSSTIPPKTIEAQCVSDADRLDALGAVGIARCFATGALLGQQVHDGSDSRVFSTKEEYKRAQQSGKGSSFNHLLEKSLLLKGTVYTAAAKRIAQRRHDFVEEYVKRFQEEWDSEDLA